MPQGVNGINEPSIKECLDTSVIVFIDDILIYLKTDQELLQEAPTILRENKLYAKFSNMNFGYEKFHS